MQYSSGRSQLLTCWTWWEKIVFFNKLHFLLTRTCQDAAHYSAPVSLTGTLTMTLIRGIALIVCFTFNEWQTYSPKFLWYTAMLYHLCQTKNHHAWSGAKSSVSMEIEHTIFIFIKLLLLIPGIPNMRCLLKEAKNTFTHSCKIMYCAPFHQ